MHKSTWVSVLFCGSAANIAAGLSAQGVKVNLLAGISNDAVGKFVKNSCNRLGIGTELLVTIPKARNTLAIVDTMGESTQAIIYRNSPADLFFDVHLMVSNPFDMLKPFIDAGANGISFHIEATESRFTFPPKILI